MKVINVICFDLDGVVLKRKTKFFSDRLAEDFNVPKEKVTSFFKNEYKQIAVGKMSLRRVLEKYILEWGVKMNYEELLKYWFDAENNTDEQVLEIVKKLRVDGYNCYLASDHVKERADNVRFNLGLEKYFDGDFFSCDIAYTKEEIDFYIKMISKIGSEPSEILFIDDDQKNLDIAKQSGINTLLFENHDQCMAELNKLEIKI